MKSLGECDDWCKETKECEMFVYDTTTFNYDVLKSICYLKKNMADKLQITKTKDRVFAGPKYCPIYEEGTFPGNFLLLLLLL